MTDFNLRQLVRDTIRTSESVEWDVIAAAVLAGMSPESHRAALAAREASIPQPPPPLSAQLPHRPTDARHPAIARPWGTKQPTETSSRAIPM
jgi:hypothetical protein